ncbi:hypothetical protein B7988_06660 [Fibrobacter sp. UWB1]|uniref:hypothetical protein n=1 Tax=Fibrobacter sp. UWB1 TaxID=1964355 RepID=UPI000B52459F|nr:hypothetical protein [Fibrobacter sp. UWB1]OWV26264.1 hypothetical protein B7988_06660 [Fibrobacter sp. UWB1]
MGLRDKIRDFFLDKSGIRAILESQNLQNRMAQESLAAITFSNAVQNSEWLKYKSFYPGRWAVEYTFLLTLFRIFEHHKFTNLLEFGLGQTSRMVHQYAAFHNVPAITVEHDTEWIEFTRKDTRNAYPINVKVLPLEMVDYNGYKTRTYQGVKTAFENQKFDFILVDGPFGSEHYSRSQITQLAKGNLAETFCIIIDDCNRIGEQETVAEVEKELKSRGIKYAINKYYGLSDYVVICSEDLKFLASL